MTLLRLHHETETQEPALSLGKERLPPLSPVPRDTLVHGLVPSAETGWPSL